MFWPFKRKKKELRVDERDLHAWFGLSYASWLVMPRVLLQEMSEEWQEKMVDLLEEFNDEFPEWYDSKIIDTFEVGGRKGGKYIRVPDWLNNYRRPDRINILMARGERTK
jgi:hypothetical protein